MSDLIRHDLLQRLITIADHEQRTVDAVLEDLLATYPNETPPEQPLNDDAGQAPPASEPWGQSVVRLLESFGPIDMAFPEIDDPVAWVKAVRQQEADRLRPYWEGEA